MQDVFAELSKGNGLPFLEIMADDISWTVTGTTKWSRTYVGKHAVVAELLQPLAAQFETQYTNNAKRFIAEGDFVIVECRGNVTTKRGRPYNNEYCFVCRFAGGRLKELTEYSDTHLAESVLDGPERP